MPAKGQKAPGTGWANPSHPMHTQPKGVGKWKDAEAGNVLNLVHGALSPRAVEPVAAGLIEQTLESTPYLADVSYRPALESWAQAEAKCRLLDQYIASVGVVDGEGKPRAALDALRLWETRASQERARLGLDPLSRAKLGKDVAATKFDLARLWAEMDDDEEKPDE